MSHINNEKLIKIREYLIDRANIEKEQVSYQKLSDDCNLNLNMGNKHHSKTMGKILTGISLFEQENNRPVISALVVREDTKIPGDGYGKIWKIDKFQEEQKKCIDYWSDEVNCKNNIVLSEEQVARILTLFKHC